MTAYGRSTWRPGRSGRSGGAGSTRRSWRTVSSGNTGWSWWSLRTYRTRWTRWSRGRRAGSPSRSSGSSPGTAAVAGHSRRWLVTWWGPRPWGSGNVKAALVFPCSYLRSLGWNLQCWGARRTGILGTAAPDDFLLHPHSGHVDGSSNRNGVYAAVAGQALGSGPELHDLGAVPFPAGHVLDHAVRAKIPLSLQEHFLGCR